MQEHGPLTFAAYDVRPGEVFVLGDNRGVSNDSRSWQAGSGVAYDAIEGRVERVLFGHDREGRLRVWSPNGTALHLTGRGPGAAARRQGALPRRATRAALSGPRGVALGGRR